MRLLPVSCLVLAMLLTSSQVVCAQKVAELPKNGIVTSDWLETVPGKKNQLCIVPADFSAPPQLVIQDLHYINEINRHGSPAWSKDGMKIAFDCQPLERDLNKSCIITCNVDGTDVRNLGLGLMPNWSPDASRIAFSTYEAPGYVCTIKADGTDRQVIPGAEKGWGTQWSPDGRYIAYYQWENECHLMVYDTEKKESRSLFPAGENPYQQIYWNFAWAPDSQKIAICGVRKNDTKKETALVTVAADNFKFEPLPSFERDTYYLDFHPNGKQLLYDEAGCIMSFDLDQPDASPKFVKGQSPDFGYNNPAVSPDGKWMLLVLH